MRVMVSGGGTGGHIYPAIAIARGICQADPSAEVLYVGTKEGMESRIVPEAGLEFRGIHARGWQGRRVSSLVQALKENGRGQKEATALIKEFRPDAVVGTGGYVCLPIAQAARKAGVAVYLHEQNAYPGLANRVISLWARKVLLTFEEARPLFPKSAQRKAVCTGLPVRPEVLAAKREKAAAALGLLPGVPTLLAAGGSRGALSINLAMLHVLKEFYGRENVQILMATGRRDYEKITGALEEAGLCYKGEKNLHVYPYLDHMELALAAADLYVGRAGATTLAELTVRGLPAILIPYPYASADHQTYNAKSLADRGAAVLLEDKGLNGPKLLCRIKEILTDPKRLEEMRKKSLDCGKPKALEEIIGVLLGTGTKEDSPA